ncbi:MAG: TAXI family TRAP transporter solute-binding subunit [Desulfobacterales bacterium]|nr:TAXI family TRAP transporter solute-binding subunit [Desulfobacterales bacterium]
MKKKTAVVSIGVAALIFLWTFSSVAHAAQDLPRSLTIGTHPKGSLLNIIGSGFAKVISLHTSISAKDRPFTGYLSWVPLMNQGRVDLGIITDSEVHPAYRGKSPYREGQKNLRLISSGNGINLGYVSRLGSGIKTMADLKDKRVPIDSSQLATIQNQEALIRAAGLDPDKDIKKILVAGVVVMVDAFMEGRADVSWGSVGMGKIKEAEAKVGGLYWIPVVKSGSDPALKMLEDSLPGRKVKFIKGKRVPGVDNDTWLLDIPIGLGTHEGLGDEAAYLITKVIWENEKELNAVHPIFRGWKKAMVDEKAVIPYHPGAIKFYREVNAWPEKMDAIQQNLLNQ